MARPDPHDDLAARRADPRYVRLMEATRAAARNGYEAVSMRELAETCRMSMTTIYQFCRSKDGLIAEAHLENMEAFRQRLTAHPPTGATAEERVLRVMRSFARALEVDEALSRTLMRALYSLDPEVGATRASVGEAYSSLLDTALGDEALADRDAVIATLGHVIDSVIHGWLAHRLDARAVRHELEVAVHALLGPRDPSSSPPARRSRRATPRRATAHRA